MPIFNTAPSRLYLHTIFPGIAFGSCYYLSEVMMHAVLFSGVLDVRHSLFGRT